MNINDTIRFEWMVERIMTSGAYDEMLTNLGISETELFGLGNVTVFELFRAAVDRRINSSLSK